MCERDSYPVNNGHRCMITGPFQNDTQNKETSRAVSIADSPRSGFQEQILKWEPSSQSRIALFIFN